MAEEIKPASPILGAVEQNSIIDTEALGERVFEPIKRTQPEEILSWLRDKLRQGYFIYATDLDAPAFQVVTDDHGAEGIASGITVEKMVNRPRRITSATAPHIRY